MTSNQPSETQNVGIFLAVKNGCGSAVIDRVSDIKPS